ncbi:unnamed protein product [Mycena citricolor]|uniref:Integrase catalytic domain-containing protein n=1 Tax=Mycena citricolor TaxID=2018698 RepID=A0AAD2HWW0_9AGAR|nr:unnamed protein product [Mycena citricolor]
MVTGLNVDESVPASTFCETCVKAKSHVTPFPPASDSQYTEIGDLTFTDVWGPSHVIAIDGSRYYVSFTDAATRRTVLYFLKRKSDIKDRMRDYVEYIQTQAGKRVKAFRCDNGGEYVNDDVRTFLR